MKNIDLNRLWIRNLGRDDRSISANKKECRFPFLDRKLIRIIENIDLRLLTNFYLPKGKGGDKIVLRLIAYKLMGLKLYFINYIVFF